MPYWIFHFFSLHFVLEKNRFVSFRLISFRFVSFRLISFRFVSIGFVSFRLISFRTLQVPFSDWPKQNFLNSTSEWVHLAWGIFGPVSIFVYCLFGVSTLSNQRPETRFHFQSANQIAKKVKFSKISKFHKISTKHFKIFIYNFKMFKKFQNYKINYFF